MSGPPDETAPDTLEYNVRWWRGAGRAALLRCPRCGQGRVFRRLFTMNQVCPRCDLTFDRGVGYWLGAMMFNMAVGFLAVLVTIGAALWITSPEPDWDLAVVLAIVIGVAAPILFFPFSRTFWIAAERAARLRDGVESE